MAQEGIPEDQSPCAAGKSGDLLWRCFPYALGSSRRRSWGKKGETPVVEATGARHGMSLISAITSRDQMRFMIKEKGGVNAAVFIEFLKRLITGAKRAIFLIVDRGPAHIAKKTKAFVESLNGRLRLFYLPPYSPDRNPDELAWKHLKADKVGRMATTDKADFQTKVRASMRQLQNDSYGLINNCGWPASNRNGVRHRVGTPGRHESEPSGDHCANSAIGNSDDAPRFATGSARSPGTNWRGSTD